MTNDAANDSPIAGEQAAFAPPLPLAREVVLLFGGAALVALLLSTQILAQPFVWENFPVVDEVAYFQSDTKYTRMVTADSETLIRKSIKELLDELDAASFWQIHRSTIVNVAAIAGVSRDIRGRMILKFKQRHETVAVSEPFMHRFKQM